MPSRINVAFILLTIRLCSPTRLSCSRLGRLASSSLTVGIATHLAVITRPPRSHPRKARLSISVSSRSVLARRCSRRYGYARCVDDMGLDVARLEPTRQPEAVAAGLESDSSAFDPDALPSPLPSSMQQLPAMRSRPPRVSSTAGARRQAQCQRRASSTGSIRQRRSAWRPDRGDLAIGSDRYTSAWGAPSVHISNDGCNILAAAP